MATGNAPGAEMQPSMTVEKFLAQFGDQCTSARETRRLASQFFNNEGTIRRIMDRLKERKKTAPQAQGVGMKSIKTLAAILIAVVLSFVTGCEGNLKDNNQKKDWLRGGGKNIQKNEQNHAVAEANRQAEVQAAAEAEAQHFIGKLGTPGYWSDGNIALEAGSRKIYVNENQSGIAGMTGNMAITISEFQNGQPILLAVTEKYNGWWNKILTTTEIPDSVREIKAVRVDANGIIVAEADNSYVIRFQGEQFFEGDTGQLRGVPKGAGDIYYIRFNVSTSTLSIRTVGRLMQLTHNRDDGAPHVIGDNEDVNGWSHLVVKNKNNVLVTSGAIKGLLLELNQDGSVKGQVDMSKAEFAANIPVTGSSAKEPGIAVYIDKGIVYPNPTAADMITPPALKSITTYPTDDAMPVGDTFTFSDSVGVFEGGYKTSVRYSTEAVGISSLPGTASVLSPFSRKGESANTVITEQTIQIGSIVSAPTTKLTVFESFLKLSASPAEIVSGGMTEITAIFYKRGEKLRDISKDPASKFLSNTSSLVMSGNIGTGGPQGNPVVEVTAPDGITKGTITITVKPMLKFAKVVLPKKVFNAGEKFTPEFIVISEGAFLPENKASDGGKWSSSNTTVAKTVVDSGETTPQSAGGKATLKVNYFGRIFESDEFTVNPATPAPPASKVTSITPASLSVVFYNTDPVQTTAVTVGKSDQTTGGAPVGVTVKSAPGFVTVTMTATGILITAKPNQSGSGNVVLTADGVDSQPIVVTLSSVLGGISKPSNLTLQVGTTSQLAGLTGTQNNTANSGGATSGALGFDKVTSASSDATVAAMNATGLVTAGSTVGTATITITAKDDPATASFDESTLSPQTFTVTVTAAPVSVLGQGGDLLSDPNWRLRYTLGVNSITFITNPAQTPNTLVNTAGATPAPFLFNYRARSAPATASAFIRTGWTVVTENGITGYSITLPIDPQTGELFHFHAGETVGGIDKWNSNAGMFLAEQSGNGTVEPGEQNKLSVDARPATATTPASVTNGGF